MNNHSEKAHLAIILLTVLTLSSVVIGFQIQIAIAVDPCTSAPPSGLGGTLVLGECQISGASGHSFTATTTLSIPETVHILATGKIIIAPSKTLTLNIAGDLIIDTPDSAGGDGIFGTVTTAGGTGAAIIINAGDPNIKGNIVLHGDGSKGATISAENTNTGCSGGSGGTINLVATGDITTEDRSIVTVGSSDAGDKCPAGTIFMQAGNAVDIDGIVRSESTQSGTGAVQRPGGGQITVNAGCDLTISDTGIVSSKGQDPGADLVHLQGGCRVIIIGLVQSTGVGHAVPNSPPNHCDSAYRPGKPTASTTCVEIVAGKPQTGPALIIDSTDGNNGQINADGGPGGRGWIDLFASGDINILGDNSGPFAVHANRGGGTDQVGGDITVMSTTGKITVSGLALSADANVAGGTGGTITVLAAGDVTLDTASLFARGDFSESGGYGFGGKIGTLGGDGVGGIPDIPGIRSFTGTVSWQNGVGDVRPTGTDDVGTKLPAANRGEIIIQDCTNGPVNLLNTLFPNNGLPATTPTELTDACGGAPSPPSYLLPLPTCQCQQETGPFCEKASVQTVLDPTSGRFPANKGPDVIVRPDHGDSIQNAIETVTDVNTDGYLIIGVVDHDNGLLGGNVFERITISQVYNLPFALIACSVTLHDPDPGANLPTAHITSGAGSPQNIFVMDLHGADSPVAGWLVEGNGRYIRNVDVLNNAVGISFVGDGNTMHNGAAEDNTGVGILIQGTGNLVDSSDSMDNGGIGIQVIGNTNKILKADVGDGGKGNLGDGINVAGNGNTIQENDVFANGGDGIGLTGNSNFLYKNDVGDRDKGNGGDGMRVAGYGNKLQENNVYANTGDGIDMSGGTSASPNVMLKNKVGDRGKSNLGNGIIVSGTGNGKPNPVEIDQNVVKANGGVGIKVTGSGHQLKSNQSGGSGSGESNGGCEYDLAAGNFDSGGNKANGASVTLTIPGCTGV